MVARSYRKSQRYCACIFTPALAHVHIRAPQPQRFSHLFEPPLGPTTIAAYVTPARKALSKAHPLATPSLRITYVVAGCPPANTQIFSRPAGLEPANSGLEMLTRSATNRHYLCRFASLLVLMGTGPEWTSVSATRALSNFLTRVMGSGRPVSKWSADFVLS